MKPVPHQQPYPPLSSSAISPSSSEDHYDAGVSCATKIVMLSIHSFTKYPTRAHAVPRPVLGPRDRAETARARPTLGGGGRSWGQ